MDKIDLQKLEAEIPYKWRIQEFSKDKASARCVAYIDARDVQRRLDEVVGKQYWQSDYKEIKGNVYCGIGIASISPNTGTIIDWVWKWDCGTESQTEAEKGEASDA